MMLKSNNNPYENKKALASSMRLVLENRLLFDGAVVASAIEVVDTKAVPDNAKDLPQDSPNGGEMVGHDTLIVSLTDKDTGLKPLPLPHADFSVGNADAPNLIILDPRAENARDLLATPPANTVIKVLDSSKDGYKQIADILKARGNTKNLLLQTANIGGRQWLGASLIRANLNPTQSNALLEWGDNLDNNAHITLYATPISGGNRLLQYIYGLTGSQADWGKDRAFGASPNDTVSENHGEKNSADISQDALTEQPTTTKTLVFVDTTVAGYQDLIKDIDTNAKVILLNNTTDEVQQIADTVSQYGDISAIHIISHGSEGQLKLGSAVLNQVTMQGMYADELAIIGQHLAGNADIFVYGCDFGQGDQGKQAANLLANLTGADVAYSTDDTGSAKLGGDWVLERSTGFIDNQQVLSAAGMASFAGLLDTPTPTVTLSGTSDVFIGSNFTFTATFDNTASTGVGYAPYIDLVLPTTGKDGAGAQTDDGVSFVSATYLGQAVKATTLTFDATGHATHPVAKDNTGAALIINAADYGLQAGDTLVVLELPFGSVTATQPTIPVLITASLSNLADVASNASKDLTISARAGFRFGADALDNPTTDPSIVQVTAQTLNVHPTVLTMTQTFDGLEQDTATGPNYVRHLTTVATPATGQTLNNFDVSQTLPDNIIVKSITPDSGGTVSSITLRDGTVITNSATISATLAAGTYLQSYTVRYTSLSAAKNTVVDFYVPDNDFAGNPIIDANSGNDVTITINPATGSGLWDTADSRDPDTTVTVTTNAGANITFGAKSIAIQKSVGIQTNTGAAGPSPGDTLNYTLNINISDYFAFGKDGSNNGAWLVNDVLDDGQTWDNGFVPTLSYTDATGSHTVVLVRGTHFTVGNAPGNDSGLKAADGKTYLQFDLAAVLTRLQGDLHGDAALSGASTVTINLRSIIDDSYTTLYSQSELNEGDSINNTVSTTGTLLNPALTLTGQNEADTSSATSTIDENAVTTDIVGVNGVLGTPSQLKPGDLVTIRIRYDLATGDYENFRLKSFLPLPVLATNDANADGTPGDTWTTGGTWNGTGGNMPTVGQWKLGNNHTAGNVTGGVSVDGTANSLTFDFGDNSNAGNNPTTAEILYTIKVSDQPFADELLLTLLAQSSQQDTVTTTSTTSAALVNITLAEPEVTIKTGVVKVSNPSASITGGSGTWVATTDTTSVPFTGTITSASAVDGNLSNFDGNDTIRLATAVENTGGTGAFDVTTTIGAPPSGLSFVGGNLASANLKVTRGDGTALVLGTDYSIVGNTITFLDNGGNATLGVGRNGTNLVTDGTNIVVITYDVISSNTVNASQNFTTDASLTNYASINGGQDFTPVDLTDNATELAAAPSVVKVFQGGSISNDDSNSPSTTGANVVVGESMLYDIKVTLPEGNTQSLRLDDLVPPGMKLDTSFNGTGYQLITTSVASGGSLSADFNGAVSVNSLTSTPSGILGNEGVDGRLTFSATSTTTADNDAGNNTFVVRVKLIADNVAGNQTGTTLNASAQLVYSDTDGNGSGPATDHTVANTGAAVTVTIREPALTINKVVSPTTPIDSGDPVTYTITITNPAGNNINAYDLIYGDTFPSQLDSITLVSALKGATDVASSFQVVGNTLQTIGGTAGNAAVNLDLAPGESITLTVSGIANGSVAGVNSFDSNSVVRWSSIDSPDNLVASQDANERTGANGVGGGLNNYAVQDGAPVTVVSVTSLTHVGGLPDTAAPEPTTNPENVAIGEIVRYRAVIRVPEGSIANYNIQASLPSGLSYINDNSTKIAFISNGVGLSTDDGALASGSLSVSGNEATNLAGDIPATLANGPTAVLNSLNITGTSQAPVFNLGNITNADSDSDGEFIVIEFNARVDNIAANTTADSFNVNFTARTGTTVLSTSNTVVENVVEPSITNLTKTVTSFDPAINPTTGQATVTLNFTNSGDGAANDVHLADSVAGGSNYTITSVIIGGTSYTVGTLPSGVTASTTGGVSVDFSQLPVGTSVSVIYTVEVPNSAPIATTDAIVTYSGLPETFTTFAGSNVGTDGATDGERDSSGGTTAPNDYQDAEGAGLGIISGTLWDDTNNANGVIDGGEARLANQTVTLVWAGADGNLATGGDNLTFTTTTDSNGDYHFGALPAGNYRITGDNGGGTITVSGDTLKPRFDSDGGTLGTVTLAPVGEGASATANIGYVQQNNAPVNAIVGAQPRHINEDAPTTITDVSISDPDAGSGLMTTQLRVLQGTLNVTLAGSASLSAGANGSASLTISGTLADINATLATLSYTSPLNYNGNDTLTIVTNDNGNTGDADGDGIPGESVQDALTDTDILNIIVDPVDDSFVDNSEVVNTPEDTPLTDSVLTGTSSVDGPVTVVSFTVAGDPATYNFGDTATISGVGTLIINQNGTYTFTPVADFNGPVPLVTYTLTDSLVTQQSTLTITVDPVADITPDSDSTTEDNSITLDVLVTDSFENLGAIISKINGTAITDGGAAVPVTNGSVRLISGHLEFTPAPNFNGVVPTFTYTVLSGGAEETADVNITVTAVNDDFTDANEVETTPEDTPLNGTVLTGTSSFDGPVTVVSFTVAGDLTTYNFGNTATISGVGTLTINQNGTYTFTPNSDFHGSVPIVSYLLTDGSGTDESSILSIAVTPVTDIVDDSGTTPEDTPITLNVLANDGFAPGAVITAINGNPIVDGGVAVTVPNGSVQLVAGQLVFTPDPDFNGTVPTITYSVTTVAGNTETANVEITVTPVADIVGDSGTTPEDSPITLDVLANDGFEANAVITAINGKPITEGGVAVTVPYGSVRLVNGKLVFTPEPNFSGPVPTFTYTALSGGKEETANVNIRVTPVNDIPVASNDGVVSVGSDQSVKGNLLTNDSDPDNDKLSVTEFKIDGVSGVFAAGSKANIPGVGKIVIDRNGNYTFTPNPGYSGPVPAITYTITDGFATSSAVLAFADVPEQNTDIGSLILLSNPNPPLIPSPSTGSSYFTPREIGSMRDTNATIISYQAAGLSMYQDLTECDLYLAGSPRNQVVLEKQSFSFSIPAGTFRHTNGSKELEYEATKPDGSPLPDWLKFNAKKMNFTGVPPINALNTDVVVIARDHCGNKVYTQFRVRVNRDQAHTSNWHFKKNNPHQHQEKANQSYKQQPIVQGKASFNDQVCSSGKLSRLLEARELLNSLNEIEMIRV